MKKLMSLFTLFMGLSIFTFAQTNITFHITSQKGKIFTEERGTYCMSFGISGLQNETEVNAFKKTIAGDSNVRNIEVNSVSDENGQRTSRLVLTAKDIAKIKALFNSANVKKLIVDSKEYSIENFDKMIEDLKVKNNKSGSSK